MGAGDGGDSRLTGRDVLRAAMLLLALSLGYYVAVQVGFAFTLASNAVSLLWPPNAILLAALILSPYRVWVWPLLAILPAHLIAELSAGAPLLMTSCWYVSNASEAVLGAVIIRSVLGDAPRFDRVRDVSVYLAAAVLAAPVLSSLLDARLVALVGWRYDGDYWDVFRMRLFSNALAAIVVPPLVIAIVRSHGAALSAAKRARHIEAVALFALLCLVSVAIFHEPRSAGEALMYVYAPLPLLVWAAVRIGAGGVSVCIAALALLSITGTLRGTGPFVLAEPEISVLALQIVLIIVAASLMLLAAALAELRDARSTALRRKERLDLALNAARMGAWEWDLTTDRITWRLAVWAGAASDGAASATEILDQVHPDDQERMATAMRIARQGGETGEVECRFLCDGRLRWVRGLGRVYRDGAGEPRAMIGVCIDTTLRKLEEIQQGLQREMLARLARAAALGELSDAVAHQLSQPIAAILLNAEAGRSELRTAAADHPELEAILADVEADAQRAGEVLRRLRTLFQRDVWDMERVQVAACIRSILALAQSDLIARNIVVNLDIDPMLPAVDAAPAQLQQVLHNLIANACDAMHAQEGERRLHIAAQRHGAEVQVAVSDNGPGVEDFGRVFEPFYSTKRRGVGLGLSVSRKIMAAHGGRLWGTRNAQAGTTFHIALPVSTEAAG